MTYLDSSAIIKLYYSEPDTKAVSAFVRTLAAPIVFSHLHSLEVRNSLRLKVFRREASAAELKRSLNLIDDDLDGGLLVRPDLNWFEVFRRAETLSRNHSSRLGSRSLDILHVASCLLLDADELLTFDDRQAGLAKRCGLNLVTIPSPEF